MYRNYDFYKLFDELCKIAVGRLGDKDIEFKTYIDPTIPKVLNGDSIRIKQIILNLLTNAIKYTEKGLIEFNVNCVNVEGICSLIISVEDTGKGIKSENIDSLFNKFERLDEDKNSTIEGTGLGLAITKKLVELMNGKIIVQSVYKSGSKFTIKINQLITNEEIKENVLVDEKEIDLSFKKILIVDDNIVNVKIATKYISKYNCQIDSVLSGREAINKVKNNNYDIVFLDIMMPNLSGIETLNIIKEDKNYSSITVALTADAVSGAKDKYLENGFDYYLTKPIDRKELKEILTQKCHKNIDN